MKDCSLSSLLALLLRRFVTFTLGAVGYGACEILWRGFTHWTMLLLGGVCFTVVFELEETFFALPVLLRSVCYGVIITSFELLCGSVVNVALGMNVWDYSDVPLNFMGQICVRFSLLWILLSFLLILMCKFLKPCFAFLKLQN